MRLLLGEAYRIPIGSQNSNHFDSTAILVRVIEMESDRNLDFRIVLCFREYTGPYDQ